MPSLCNVAVTLALQGRFTAYWSKFTEPSRNPFRGLYQLNGFDLGIMIPYFAVLVVLAAYGLHRYYLVYTYFKNRQNVPGPPPNLGHLPRVTVQLPIYNERYVIERLVEAVARFDYPRELLEIQVLDDSTDETQEVAAAVRGTHAGAGHLDSLYSSPKSGGVQGRRACGRAQVAPAANLSPSLTPISFRAPISCAGRCRTWAQPKIAMVQTRWTYLNRDYSALTEVESILLDGHFVIEHGSRSRSGHFFNFNGTAGVWRRSAIEDAGGWQHDTLTEDTDLSYRAQLRGWEFVYLADVECPSELPIEMNAFKAQQARWAKGLLQTAKKILPRVLRSDVPLGVKMEAVFHLTAGISYPLMIALSTLLLPAMIVRFYQGWFQMLLIDLPLFLASSCSISGFYLAAERALFPKTWKRTVIYLPLVMAVGIGLSVRNAKGVLEALLGMPSEFVRTPKYKIEGQSGARSWGKKQYRNRAGWLPYIEVALGLYFAATIAYAIQNENYATIPFLLLFVWGYLYTGLMSLGQAYFERLRFGVSIPEETRSAASGVPGF